MGDIDRMFTPGGLAVALMNGCELAVDLPGQRRDVYIDKDDMRCADCGGSIDVPKYQPARFLALNKTRNDGKCRACGDASFTIPF